MAKTLEQLRDEMTEWLINGGFFSPDLASLVTKASRNAVQDWRDDITALLAASPAAPPRESAGDLLCAAVDAWVAHGMTCEADPCPDCDAVFNRIRLAWKCWASSRHQRCAPVAVASAPAHGEES